MRGFLLGIRDNEAECTYLQCFGIREINESVPCC